MQTNITDTTPGIAAGPLFAALLLAACTSNGDPAAEGDGSSSTSSSATTSGPPAGTTTAVGSTGSAATTGDSTAAAESDGGTTIAPPILDVAIPDAPSDDSTTGEPIDCDADLLPLPLPFVTVSGATSSEDFVFDADGYLLNVANGGDLLRAEYGEASTLWYPGVGPGFAAGTAMRSNGDVVFNSGGEVRRVGSDGTVQVLAAGLSYPNGLAVDLDDFVYVAEQSGNRVVRIDPDTLDVDVISNEMLSAPNGLAFDATYDNLYVGSFGGGTVHRINIPTGVTTLFSSGIGTGGLDGIAVDACDNVYVTDFGPGIVYRVDGDVHELVADLPAGWIPNMHFGSGVGGWDENRLYVMDLGGDRVFELDLGVPGIPLPQL